MNFLRIKVFALLLLSLSGAAQKKNKKADAQILDNLHNHIQYLADDKLEGRRTGTNGEKLAMEYISNQFKMIGLIPKGAEEYYQAFDVNDGKQMNPATQLMINENKLEAGKDFFIFPFSPNKTIEATPAIAIRETDMPWFIDLKETLEENKDNPHFYLADYIKTNVEKSKSKGASAIIFYNTSSIDDKLQFEAKDKSPQSTIPALYINKEAAQKYFLESLIKF